MAVPHGCSRGRRGRRRFAASKNRGTLPDTALGSPGCRRATDPHSALRPPPSRRGDRAGRGGGRERAHRAGGDRARPTARACGRRPRPSSCATRSPSRRSSSRRCASTASPPAGAAPARLSPDDASRVRIPLPASSGPGRVAVRWVVRSGDGHLIAGTLGFTVTGAPLDEQIERVAKAVAAAARTLRSITRLRRRPVARLTRGPPRRRAAGGRTRRSSRRARRPRRSR